jgi:hypothetical protein
VYSVYQHWDKLKVCIVGRSYPPEFYSYITNPRVRNVMERIAIETEEDFQKLIKLLESFNVTVHRPNIDWLIEYNKETNLQSIFPSVFPRDDGALIGTNFYWDRNNRFGCYSDIIKLVQSNGNDIIYDSNINSATITRVGKDLYIGTQTKLNDVWTVIKKKGWPDEPPPLFNKWSALYNTLKNKNLEIAAQINLDKLKYFSDYRCNIISSEGHLDGCFCPIVPGLIVGSNHIQDYSKNFPDWEVINLPDQNWDRIEPFIKLRMKNKGKWWVPDEELNDDFNEYVTEYLSHWVGDITETVFDVNLLVIDEKNVVCLGYDKQIFKVLEKYRITPHIVDFRHKFFWDGGLHCITQDLDRGGVMEDYFPERGEP